MALNPSKISVYYISLLTFYEEETNKIFFAWLVRTGWHDPWLRPLALWGMGLALPRYLVENMYISLGICKT